MKKFNKREKMLLVIGIAFDCTAGYFGYRYGLKQSVNDLVRKNDLLENKVKNLQEAASEGLYEEAIATVTRKINHLKDQIDYCTDRLTTNCNDIQTENALINYKEKLGVLMVRKTNFIEAQKAYELIVD